MSISVCLAVHNGERFLQTQMVSILSQLDPADELLVSDDASTDGSLMIITSFSDARLRLLPARTFGNPNDNFEYLLGHCRHDYIFIADQDDVWHPDKRARMTSALQKADLVVSDCRIIDSAGAVIYPSYFSIRPPRPGVAANVWRNSFTGCCMAFRKKVLEKALPFPAFGGIYDQWLGLVAARYFTITFLAEALVDYRRHGNNFSSTTGTSKLSLGQQLMNRIRLMKILFRR